MQEKIKIVRNEFKGRADIVAQYYQSNAGDSGYSPMCRNKWKKELCDKKCWSCDNADYIPWSDDLVLEHFKGEKILGVYPLLKDNTCHFIAADFDNGNGSNPYDDVRKYREACEVQDMPCYLFRSKSGEGYHAYIFFNDPVPAWKARAVSFALLQEASVVGEDVEISSFDRLFPNQDELSGKGFGNLIALPYQGKAGKQGHTVILDPSTDFKEPFKEQFEILGNLNKVAEPQLDELIKTWDLKKEKIKQNDNRNPDGWLAEAMKGVPEGQRDVVAARIGGYWINKVSPDDVLTILRVWNMNNKPPLSDEQIIAKARSVSRYEPEKPEPLKAKELKERSKADFPYHVLKGAAGYVADVYDDIIESPKEFIFMAYLTCLGATLSRNLKIASVLKTQPRLFTVLLGESATDRKSTSLNIIHELFKSVLSHDFKSCWGLGSAEGLRKIVKNNEEKTKTGTILIFDEFKAFVSKCNIQQSVLLPIVNSLFESNMYETYTKKDSIKIDDAYLSMLAATTIPTYETIYGPSFLDIGFTNRVFLVPGKASNKFSIPKTVPEEEYKIMKGNLVGVLKHVGTGLELDLTPEAYQLYDDWYNNIETSVHAKRLDTYSLRLMLLLAVNNLKTIIDAETVQDAIDLCDWQFEVRKLHDPIDADSKFAKMEQSIRRQVFMTPQ